MHNQLSHTGKGWSPLLKEISDGFGTIPLPKKKQNKTRKITRREGQPQLATHVPHLNGALDKLINTSHSFLLTCLREGKSPGNKEDAAGRLGSPGSPVFGFTSSQARLECDAASQSLLAEGNKFFIFLTRTHTSPLKLSAFLIQKCIPGYTREGATRVSSGVRESLVTRRMRVAK